VAEVTIEESDDERSIVTPELRLRFHWVGDRWAHAIDIRPGPWQAAADSIEGGTEPGDPEGVGRPTYQEIHFQPDGDAVLALAVGRSGHHHISASFRVHHRAFEVPHFRIPNILQRRSVSRVEIDVADRCRAETPALEARYRVHAPPIVTHLGDSADGAAPGRFHRDWRPGLAWEASVAENYHVALGTSEGEAGSRVAVLDRDPAGDWFVRVAPREAAPRGTTRFSYSWEHHRVRVIRLADPEGGPP
jgi:hypothetical protein